MGVGGGGVGVNVRVGVGVGVGVDVGVGVGVGVLVDVGVAVAVFVAVPVGVFVAVGVGVRAKVIDPVLNACEPRPLSHCPSANPARCSIMSGVSSKLWNVSFWTSNSIEQKFVVFAGMFICALEVNITSLGLGFPGVPPVLFAVKVTAVFDGGPVVQSVVMLPTKPTTLSTPGVVPSGAQVPDKRVKHVPPNPVQSASVVQL